MEREKKMADVAARPCTANRRQASFRLNALRKESSFRLNGLTGSSNNSSNSKPGSCLENSSRLPSRSNHSFRSTHTSRSGNASVSTSTSFVSFGASIRISGDESLASFGDMDRSDMSMSNSNSSQNYRRWGGRSVKFSAKNFVAQKQESLEDHYIVGELLGEGGFGEVFACTHIQSREERAVKVILKSEDEAENLTVIEEFDIVKDLDHPNILKMYALFESETHFFLITDLYAGGELYEELEECGRFEEEEAALLMNNVLSCINYCHKKGLIHRDLKPENILLEDNKDFDDLKVIDFGLSEYGERFTELQGSSYYVSPQVVKGDYTCKADVFSIGVIAYVCLAGYAPFEGGCDDEVLDSVLAGEFDFSDPAWDEVSDEAKDFVASLLSYEEEDRPSAEKALQHPWLKAARASRANSSDNYRQSSRKSLACLQSFQANSKLKQCVCSLIASQLLRKDEKEEIDSVFRSLDFDCDGKLTRDDVMQSYKEFFGEELSKNEIDLMFRQVNFSGSGAIEYSEFVASTVMEKNLVDEAKLMAAFKIFDRDDKGYISDADLKVVLALDDDMEDYILHKIIKQVDQNGDGKIQFNEFSDMMFVTETASKTSSRRPQKASNMPRRGKPSNEGSGSTNTTVAVNEDSFIYNYEDENEDFRTAMSHKSDASLSSFKSVYEKFNQSMR